MSRSRNQGSNPVKTEENAVVKASEVGSKKIKYAFHISHECMKAINDMYKKDGSTTRNEFIENAVNFYIDYLKGGTMTNYLAPIIKRMVEATVETSEQRISRNLFKIAVELGKISHMVAATNDIDDETVDSLHRMCVDEVRRINGVINYESAVRFQKDE